MGPRKRSLILLGCDNVGKSTFLNAVTRAAVDVAVVPGHPDKQVFWGTAHYSYMQWQVLDVRGLFTDSELSTTAIAFLDEFQQSAILFFIDLSEECGTNISDQVDLLWRLQPLFANGKQLVVVLSKSDRRRLEDLPSETQSMLTESFKQCGAAAVCPVNLGDPASSDGPDALLKVAGELVLKARMDMMLTRR